MIVFVPAYDEATQSNLNLAKQIYFPADFVLLFGEQATRENLLICLTESMAPLFAMSHGQKDILHSQDSNIALSIKDSVFFGQRSAYVFACHTAVSLGQEVSQKRGIWWGYSDSVMCYIDEPSSCKLFVDIFKVIYENFAHAKTQEEVQKLGSSE
ncbi:MAG: hypothetical protein VKJ02_05315 [Snowella sp.]|nr:hypothetical protein [Snowella sp.]